MAVQALAPYYQQEEVKEKVDAALSILSESQLADGSFSYKGTGDTLVSTAESTAQVITALCSLGINPETDERFVKQGNSAVDALIGFYDEESNSFCHTTQPDAMATEQAVYALVSYDRLLAAKNTLYDMADRTDIYSIKPATPALGNISNQKAGIRVTWKTVSNAEGYYVYRKTTGGSYKYLTRISGGSSWYYTDTTAMAGSTYTYTVRAYRKSTLSGYVAAGSTIKRLAEPVPVVTNTASGIHISWNQIKGATGYYVYRKAGNATKWSRIATIKGAAVVSYQDTGVSNGVKYIYTVRAVSGTSLSSYYAGRVIYRLSRETVRTISNSGAGKISLTWTKYLSAGYYQIQYSTSSSMTGAKTINTSSNGVISTTISGLTKGKTYYVRIRCVKSAGGVTSIGAWSQIRSVKVSK
jgi:hypothetical protein